MRSSPAPVSMFFLGSSVRAPSASRLYCMKTRFQISTKRSSPPNFGPPSAPYAAPLSMKISESGPQGPVSPMAQKLSSSPMRWMRSAGKPDLLDPDLLGLVVAVVHGDPQAVGVQAEDVGQQPPGHGDGLFLEVVAEAEVAQHLEEGAVVGVGADDLDVQRAEALLNAGGPGPGRRLVPDEVGLEGDHAGDGEEHRRVVGDQAGRGDGGVAPLGEVAREGRPQFVGVHRASLPAATGDAQPVAMPTMGRLRRMPPVEP